MEELLPFFLFIFYYFAYNKYGDFMIINNSKVNDIVKENSKEKNKIKKCFSSFFYGGLIGLFAQGLFYMYSDIFNLIEDVSSLLTSATVIFISVVLTCFGIFDKFVNISYSGALIPISGFANSITSSALEGKSEGMIFGIGSKIFSLIGSVCTYGIVSSIICGFIYLFYLVISNA